MRLALRILRPHSHSHCLTVSLSLISLISFSSLSSLSHLSHLSLSLSLSLSLLSVSRFSVSLLSLLSQEDPGKEPHIKDSSPLPPKRAPCFFLPRCPPLSHSGALAFAPPLGLKLKAEGPHGVDRPGVVYYLKRQLSFDSKGVEIAISKSTFQS